jgi:anti-sigma factor RsiW
MILRFFLLTWLLPFAAWSQGNNPAPVRRLSPKLSASPPSPPVEQALIGSINVRIMELAAPTYLYRHLSDSSRRHTAWELKRGHFVIVEKAYPRWLAVRLAAGPTQFSGNNTIYYIPITATVGSKTYIVL